MKSETKNIEIVYCSINNKNSTGVILKLLTCYFYRWVEVGRMLDKGEYSLMFVFNHPKNILPFTVLIFQSLNMKTIKVNLNIVK